MAGDDALCKEPDLAGEVTIADLHHVVDLEREDDAPLELGHDEREQVAVIRDLMAAVAAAGLALQLGHRLVVGHGLLDLGLGEQVRVLPPRAHTLPEEIY
jgi:hypothetical protein